LLRQEYRNFDIVLVRKSDGVKAQGLVRQKRKRGISLRTVSFDGDPSRLPEVVGRDRHFVFVASGDTLRTDALFRVVQTIQSDRFDVCYSDELRYEKRFLFRLRSYCFRGALNVAALGSTDWIGNFLVISGNAIATIHGCSLHAPGFAYCLTLKALRSRLKFGYIPYPICTRNPFESDARKMERIERQKQILEADLLHKGFPDATVVPGRLPGSFHAVRRSRKDPKVSIVIPFRDHFKLLLDVVESVVAHTDYPSYEIILADNQSVEKDTIAAIEDLKRKHRMVRVVKYPHLFNFSAINNFAIKKAKGELVLLMNNDVQAFRPDWLMELVQHALDPDVAAVGPMLLYDDLTIQHAGVVIGLSGLAGHLGIGLPFNAAGIQFGRLVLEHDVSCVTGACMLVKKKVWKELGGMDEELPVAFNDVDFCLRVRELGYRIVYNPYSMLFHYESKSRGSDLTPENRGRFNRDKLKIHQKWGDVLFSDPYFSESLSKLHADGRIVVDRTAHDSGYDKLVDSHFHLNGPVVNY